MSFYADRVGHLCFQPEEEEEEKEVSEKTEEEREWSADDLPQIEAEVDDLQQQFDDAVTEKHSLSQQLLSTRGRLKAATDLIQRCVES